MKAAVLAVAFASSFAVVHAGEIKSTDMKDMSPSQMSKDAKPGKHTAKGTVKSVDTKAQTVTLDHEPVKSMSWPSMTMTFKVQDKTVMDKLSQGKKVEVQFEQRGKDYLITAVK
jgi:Cu(I)/Ag(I) efflux system protein CusF